MKWIWRALVAMFAGLGMYVQAQTVISSVDTTLVGSQKYVLRVGGQPYFLNDIQLRPDKVRNYSAYLFTWPQVQAMFAQTAADGYNTATVDVCWYDVETSMNTFDWTILDNYLGYINQYNLKMEMNWLGSNSTGSIQYLGDSAHPVHLRVPDYVLYSPSYQSSATTSTYTIDTGHPYTLDATDPNLLAREQYVLGQVMAHIAAWDAANGSRHPVIGVNVENEFNDPNHSSPAESLAYISGVASAVKNSNYIVWTRANTIDSATENPHRIAQNEIMRSNTGTYIDFVGIDDYSSSVTNIQGIEPLVGKNFPMIMENGGGNPYEVKLAALAGNEAFDTYDFCGPDAGEGMYVQTSPGVCTPGGSFVTQVVLNNQMLNTDPIDLALNAQGQGLFVHNWANTGVATTGGTLGVSYTPTATTDEGISILRSSTEIVLMNTGGGTFTLPASLQVSGASQGYFDVNNAWVNQGAVSFTPTSITPTAFSTVRLVYQFPAPQAPTNFTVTSVSNAQISLGWDATATATSYKLMRGTASGGPYTTIASGLMTTVYTDTGLTNGTTYYYVVAAVNPAGPGPNSSEVNGVPATSVTVIAVPNFSFETPSTTTYTFNPTGASWTFNEISTVSGSGVTANASHYTSSNSNAPDGVQVAFLQEKGTITQAISGFTPGIPASITFMASQRENASGGQLGETFDLQINGTSIASFSPSQSLTTYTQYTTNFTPTAATETIAFVGTNVNGGNNSALLDNVQIVQVKPAAPPSGVTAWSGDNLASLNWAESTSATSYNVKRATMSGGSYTTIASPTTTSYRDSGVTDGTVYYYVISAVNTAGESANSAQVSASPVSGMIMVPNYSFEVPVTSTYLYNPRNAWWTFSGASPSGSGISANGSVFTSGNSAAPNGSQAGFIEETGSISQTLSGFTLGTSYTVTFLASERQTVGSGTQTAQTFDLRIDGTTIASFAPAESQSGYSTYTAKFTATNTTHALAFVGTDRNAGDSTIFIDNVQVRRSPVNVWAANGNGTLSGISSNGGAAITTVGVGKGGAGVAIDNSGNVWSLNTVGNSLSEVSSTGNLVNASIVGGGISAPSALAIDGQGYIWVANGNNTVSIVNSVTGSPVSSTPYTGPFSAPNTVNVDSSGNLWITSAGNNTITKIVGAATPIATPQVISVTNNTVAARP